MLKKKQQFKVLHCKNAIKALKVSTKSLMNKNIDFQLGFKR